MISKEYCSFINGKFIKPDDGDLIKLINPANGEEYTKVFCASEKDVDTAVDAAWEAFSQWKYTNGRQRADYLFAMSKVAENNLEYLATIESINNGKLMTEALADISDVIDELQYFAACARVSEGEFVGFDTENFNIIKREPLGVVAEIVPWNYPLSMAIWKIAPALAAGNTIVIKPSSKTPLSLLEFVRLTEGILPNGVLNVIVGRSSICGTRLTKHPKVSKISFTGSTEIGRSIGAIAGEKLVPATMELGGKSPQIIFSDCLIEKALAAVQEGILSNAGQICSAGSRVLVEESLYDVFLEKLAENFDKVRLGSGLDPESQMGPVVDEGQMRKILEYIEIGKAEGAKLVCGGYRAVDDGLEKGYFIKPTIFADLDNSYRIAREEIFGPVLVVIPFRTEEEAIAIANDTNYGLAGSVWSQDISKAFRVADKIDAGLVWINGFDIYPAGTPFGGYKESGYGREAHASALNSYTQIKTLHISTSLN